MTLTVSDQEIKILWFIAGMVCGAVVFRLGELSEMDKLTATTIKWFVYGLITGIITFFVTRG